MGDATVKKRGRVSTKFANGVPWQQRGNETYQARLPDFNDPSLGCSGSTNAAAVGHRIGRGLPGLWAQRGWQRRTQSCSAGRGSRRPATKIKQRMLISHCGPDAGRKADIQALVTENEATRILGSWCVSILGYLGTRPPFRQLIFGENNVAEVARKRTA
ncbi:hypothetical protein VTG60DRAFT_5359 [Thermothelomyces hinnuleus]